MYPDGFSLNGYRGQWNEPQLTSALFYSKPNRGLGASLHGTQDLMINIGMFLCMPSFPHDATSFPDAHSFPK